MIVLRGLHKLTYEHVHGHSGHPENEYVDKLCTAAMDEFLEAQKLNLVSLGP